MSNLAQIIGRGICILGAMGAAVGGAEPGGVGKTSVDAREMTVSFDAKVNMRDGQVEYLVVHGTGKIHESIFTTTASAKEMHVAALLFAEGVDKPKLKVETISAVWIAEGKTNRVNVGELIIDKKKGRPRSAIQWTYRGSRVVNGVFLAEREGSVIAIMEDQDALIDQAAPDASDDENWEPNAKALPAIGTEVRVELKFAKSGE